MAAILLQNTWPACLGTSSSFRRKVFPEGPCTRSIQQAPDSEGCKQCQSLTKSQAKFNFLSKIVWHSHHSTLKHIASTQQKMPYLTIIRSLLLLLIHCLWHAGIWIASTQVSLDLTEFLFFPKYLEAAWHTHHVVWINIYYLYHSI